MKVFNFFLRFLKSELPLWYVLLAIVVGHLLKWFFEL